MTNLNQTLNQPPNNSILSVPVVDGRLRQPSQTAVIALPSVKKRPPMNGQPATTGLMSVQNAATRLQNPKSDTPPATAALPVKNEPNSDDTGRGKRIKASIYTVYTVRHPETQAVVYVGSAKDLQRRGNDYFGNGSYERVASSVLDWLATLKHPPVVEPVEKAPITKIREREQYWIDYYREQGQKLLNVRDAYQSKLYVCQCHDCTNRFYAFNKTAKYCSNGCKNRAKQRRRRNGTFYEPVDPLNSRGFVDPPVVGKCRYCGKPLTRKSRNGRVPKFCNSDCRVRHWRQNQKEEGEAGGGRVVVFLALATAVLIAWWFWPLLADVATMRPRLPHDNGPAVIEFTREPEMWPNITPAPTNQAVTDAWATVFAQMTAMPGQPVPGQVTPVLVLPAERDRMPYTIPAGVTPYAGMPTITETPTAVPANGDTFTLTTGEVVAKPTAEFYADCAYKQAKGQRARPDCPPNAAQLLGGGR